MTDEEIKWEIPIKNNSKKKNSLGYFQERKLKEILLKSRADSYGPVELLLRKVKKSDSAEYKQEVQRIAQEAIDILHIKGKGKEARKYRKLAQKMGIHLKNPAKDY